MITFLISLVVLIVGFALYSKLIEKVFRVDDRQTPAVAHPDGVDYTPMKTWRLFLIQLLNIAGLGPIFGALDGACWGPRVYLWIVFGTILGGGVHDYLSGMLSERHDGASISEIVGKYLGKFMLQVMRVFSVILLILVGVNFSKNPAQLLAILTPETLDANFWLAVVLIYYFIATFVSIDKIIGTGISMSPEGRRVFPDMTVLENLKIGAYLRKDKAAIEEDVKWVYSLFPRLEERSWQLAGTLSGGEQQMLAVGRALMSRPKLLLLDEPSLGLAPLVVQDIFSIVREINRQGVTVLLIEQNANMALKIADQAYVLETGRITMSGTGAELLADERVKEAYLGKHN